MTRVLIDGKEYVPASGNDGAVLTDAIARVIEELEFRLELSQQPKADVYRSCLHILCRHVPGFFQEFD
jgi:hypothetical protein